MPEFPLLIAHRGESFDAPENTLAAFQLAWDRGIPAVELDVHVTSDGHAVVCHDEDTERTGGVKLVIKDRSLAVLRAIDVGAWKSPAFAGQVIPTLAEVFQGIPAGRCVFVEIKPGVEAVSAVAKVVNAGDWSAIEIRFMSFSADVVAELKRQLPKYGRYWLIEPEQDKQGRWSPTPAEIAQTALAAGATGVDVGDGAWLTAEAVGVFRDAKLDVVVWTVDDPERCKVLAGLGVSGITTNRAAWIRDQIS